MQAGKSGVSCWQQVGVIERAVAVVIHQLPPEAPRQEMRMRAVTTPEEWSPCACAYSTSLRAAAILLRSSLPAPRSLMDPY